MDAVATLTRIIRLQNAFKVIGTLMLTAYLFPPQAVVVDKEEFDFIVVGAGSAGAVVAARLAQCHFKVLLVEAGGDPPQESLVPSLLIFPTLSQHDWNYTTENDNCTFQCHRSKTGQLTSGRVLGGGSSINYMLYVRGCPGDFDPWAAAAKHATWSWSGVLPYFMKSEKLEDPEILNSPLRVYHGTEGFLGVSRQMTVLDERYSASLRELDHDIILDINANYHTGYNLPMFTISNGVRQSTAYTALGGSKGNKNLHVLKHTLVTKILLDRNNNAVGVEAITTDDKKITLKARKEIIVSAGALNSPRLLMLSGVGPKKHLRSLRIPVRSDLPVGKNLQDHLAFIMATKLEEESKPAPVHDPRRYPLDMFTGYVAFDKSNVCPDYQTANSIVPNDSLGALNLCVFNFGFDFKICQEIFEAGKGRRILLSLIDLLHPKSRGQVLLRSTNPRDPPLIHDWHTSDERDLESIVDAAIDFSRIVNTTYFKSINAEVVRLKSVPCTGFKYWSRDWWRCYVKCMMFPFHHYGGTCSLGSVVDSHLRVFGVNRLRVADASIMPELVSANTNAASIMIGEKAADFIKQKHGCISNSDSFPPSAHHVPDRTVHRWF